VSSMPTPRSSKVRVAPATAPEPLGIHSTCIWSGSCQLFNGMHLMVPCGASRLTSTPIKRDHFTKAGSAGYQRRSRAR
jgi:hypothetical protein